MGRALSLEESFPPYPQVTLSVCDVQGTLYYRAIVRKLDLNQKRTVNLGFSVLVGVRGG